jgi:hypothetical protein
LVEDIRARGGNVTREPGPVKGGQSVIAFVKDPDGYAFELIQRGPTPEPLCQVMLRVGDLDRSIKFYEKVISLKLFIVCHICGHTYVWNVYVFESLVYQINIQRIILLDLSSYGGVKASGDILD